MFKWHVVSIECNFSIKNFLFVPFLLKIAKKNSEKWINAVLQKWKSSIWVNSNRVRIVCICTLWGLPSSVTYLHIRKNLFISIQFAFLLWWTRWVRSIKDQRRFWIINGKLCLYQPSLKELRSVKVVFETLVYILQIAKKTYQQ